MGENETRFLSLSGQGFQLIRGTVMAEKKEFIRIRGARENNLKALNVLSLIHISEPTRRS